MHGSLLNEEILFFFLTNSNHSW